MAGLTLVELMVAMLLGLLIVGAAVSIFASNTQAYRSTQNLGRIQETGQVAFEMMARDIREAGSNPCGVYLPEAVANVINGYAGNWYTHWDVPIVGYDNGSLAGSKAGTDAIQILREADDAIQVDGHSGTTLTVKGNPHTAGDYAMVCDIHQLALFRVGAATATTISHAASAGNCSNKLGARPAQCAAEADYEYQPPKSIAPVVSGLRAVRWFVADNGRGGSSLFMQEGAGAAQEVAEGVSDMQITYLHPAINASSYVAASAIAANRWDGVTAVRVAMDVEGPDVNAAVGGGRIKRRVEHVIGLRSRNP